MLNLLLVKISFLAHKMTKYHVILKIISSYDQQYIYLKKSVLTFQFILSVFSNCRDFFKIHKQCKNSLYTVVY